MRPRKAGSQTLAATLDRTKWDYSPETDRSFLLSSVERVFASVAWEVPSQHLTPVTAEASSGPSTSNETQPLKNVISRYESD